MAAISLTHFVDFVKSAGAPKLTVVKNTKQQLAKEYNPATDFYKALRDGILAMHKTGLPKSTLDSILEGLADKKKKTGYPPLVSGYKKFLGKKNATWFNPPRDEWSHGGLTVNINPEVGLKIDGCLNVIKLYFKAEALSKLRVDVVTQLMSLVLSKPKTPVKFSVLDVRNAKLFTSNGTDKGLIALLQGEAASFASILNALPG